MLGSGLKKLRERDLLLYAVTDRSWLGDRTLAWQVEEALKGGATMVQLREKHLDRDAFRTEALELQALCGRYGAPFLIDDDVSLAVEIGASGVHVGQHDMEAGQVREQIGPEMILGVSVQTVGQALAAQAAGADYLGVGAVFPTGTKDGATTVSFEALRSICRTVDIPVVAIGGIGPHNIAQLAGSGICGAAVVSALFAQADVQSAARRLRELTQEVVDDHDDNG